MRTLFSLFLGLLLCSSALFAQGTDVTPKDPQAVYQHAETKFVYPPTVAGFAREDITQYDEKGLDIGAGYRHPARIFATVYVYPNVLPPECKTCVHPAVPQDLKAHFEQCSQHIAKYPGAKLVKTEQIQITANGKVRDGWRAEYHLPQGMRQGNDSLHSQLWVFSMEEKWFFKFRITYPTAVQEQAAELIPTFVRAFAWPSGL